LFKCQFDPTSGGEGSILSTFSWLIGDEAQEVEIDENKASSVVNQEDEKWLLL